MKNAFLTIDDAPTKDFIKKLQILEDRNIRGVFYCTGENLNLFFDESVEALKRGHIIGNHSYNHMHFSEITLEEAKNQIIKTDKIIEKTYSKAGMEIIKTFRFPFGDKGWGDDPVGTKCSDEKLEHYNAIQEFLKSNGYKQPKYPGVANKFFDDTNLLNDIDVYWTYDCKEWAIPFGDLKFEDILARMDIDDKQQSLGLNSKNDELEIILTHDHVETTDIFEQIIDKLLTKSLKFILPEF